MGTIQTLQDFVRITDYAHREFVIIALHGVNAQRPKGRYCAATATSVAAAHLTNPKSLLSLNSKGHQS